MEPNMKYSPETCGRSRRDVFFCCASTGEGEMDVCERDVFHGGITSELKVMAAYLSLIRSTSGKRGLRELAAKVGDGAVDVRERDIASG
jgi:hypothetical protein